MTGDQLDIFGETTARLDAAANRANDRTTRQAAFDVLTAHHPDGTQVIWIAPWDCSDGTPKGTAIPGRRCPLCDEIEPNEHLLSNNHWIDVDEPHRWRDDPDAQCCVQILQATHNARPDAAPC